MENPTEITFFPKWRSCIVLRFYEIFFEKYDNLYQQQDSAKIVCIVGQSQKPNIVLLKYKKAINLIEKNSFCTNSFVGLFFTNSTFKRFQI